MCRPNRCPESVLIILVSLLTNLVLGVIEIGNFYAGQAFEKCGPRPDRFWRCFILFQMLVVGLLAMFTIDRGRLADLLPGYEFNSRVKDLPGKTFVALEITGLLIFTMLVVVAHSTCSIKGVWVALYYWLLAVIAFVLACLLILLWFVAGHHVFRQYNSSNHYEALKPYILSIKNAETEQDQRNQYRQFRTAVDGLYGADGFSELDFPFIEKYSMHLVDRPDLERDLYRYGKICIQCDESFKVGDKFMIFRECLHACHFSCLVHRLRFSDLCFCSYGIRYVVTDPCLPGGTKESIEDLINLHLSCLCPEAVMCWRQPDMDGQEPTQSDYLEHANFWDIKEEGVEEYLAKSQGSQVLTPELKA